MHILKLGIYILSCSLYAAAAARVQVAEFMFDSSVLSNICLALLSPQSLLGFMSHKLLFSLQL